MNPGKYAKAFIAAIGTAAAWFAANVEITDTAIVIPLSPEAAGMAAGAAAIVFGVWRVPNKEPDKEQDG